jgi:hypothetical protein
MIMNGDIGGTRPEMIMAIMEFVWRDWRLPGEFFLRA